MPWPDAAQHRTLLARQTGAALSRGVQILCFIARGRDTCPPHGTFTSFPWECLHLPEKRSHCRGGHGRRVKQGATWRKRWCQKIKEAPPVPVRRGPGLQRPRPLGRCRALRRAGAALRGRGRGAGAAGPGGAAAGRPGAGGAAPRPGRAPFVPGRVPRTKGQSRAHLRAGPRRPRRSWGNGRRQPGGRAERSRAELSRAEPPPPPAWLTAAAQGGREGGTEGRREVPGRLRGRDPPSPGAQGSGGAAGTTREPAGRKGRAGGGEGAGRPGGAGRSCSHSSRSPQHSP